MQIKEFLSILLLFIMIFIGIGAMSSTVHGADVDVISDFDNNTLTTVELSESQSKTIWGFENLAKVQTRTGGDMQNTHIETDEGLYNYEYMILNDTIMEKNDRVYGKNGNQTLYAHYSFSPYAFAEIDVIDLHGHSSSSSTYPAMKHNGDSITKTFKPFTDVETGYSPLYILDLDTNVKYQPGDKFTISYIDVIATGLNKIIKTFQYVYAKDIVIENIIVENKTIENISYVNKTIEVPIYVNKTIENITYIDKVVEVPVYVNKTVEVPVYVNKTVEVINYVNKTVEVIKYVNKTIEVINYVNKTIEVPFYKVIVVPEIIIDNPVIPISNNNNTDQYNETNPVEVPNNNMSNVNNVTTKLNKENSIGTSTSDNLKTVTMKRTGTDNPIGLIIVIILFGILILIYNREDD